MNQLSLGNYIQQDSISGLFWAFLDRLPSDKEIQLEENQALVYIFSSVEFIRNSFGFYCDSDFSRLKINNQLIDFFYKAILNRSVENDGVYEEKLLACSSVFELRVILLKSEEFLYRKREILLQSYDAKELANIASILLLGRPCLIDSHLNLKYASSLINSPEFMALEGFQLTNIKNEKSLILVGFPKGVTSAIYQFTIRSLYNTLSPFPAVDGEVFNVSRHVNSDIASELIHDTSFYSDSDVNWSFFEKVLDRLTNGFVIKDVCYPFHIYKYLQLYPNRFNVVFINRDIDLVNSIHETANWTFATKEMFGLVKEKFVNFPTIDADQFLNDPNHYLSLLKKFYKHAEPVCDFDLSR